MGFTYVPLAIDKSSGLASPQILMVNPWFRMIQALNTGDGATSQLRTWTRKTPLLAGAPGPCEGTACDDYGVTRFTVNVLP